MRPAFTLIELLIVVALIGGTMAAVTQLLATTIAGTSKSRSLQQVKENGQFAISQIQRTVTRASSVTSCGSDDLSVVVPEASGDTYVDTNYAYVRDGVTSQLKLNNFVLVDQELDVTALTCAQTGGSGGEPPFIQVSLTLQKAGLGVKEAAVAQTFETTVLLRTY